MAGYIVAAVVVSIQSEWEWAFTVQVTLLLAVLGIINTFIEVEDLDISSHKPVVIPLPDTSNQPGQT